MRKVLLVTGGGRGIGAAEGTGAAQGRRVEPLAGQYRAAAAGQTEISRREMAELRRNVKNAADRFNRSLRDWKNAWSRIPAQA